jgi:hypothetical protein
MTGPQAVDSVRRLQAHSQQAAWSACDYPGALRHCSLSTTTMVCRRRKTGYGSYGPSRGRKHGARVIILKQDQTARLADSYLRLEDGSIKRQQRSWKPFHRLQSTCSIGAPHSGTTPPTYAPLHLQGASLDQHARAWATFALSLFGIRVVQWPLCTKR